MSIESGRYIITHAQYCNLAFLSDTNDGTSLLGCLEQDVPGEEWSIKELRNGRYSIVNFGHKMSASAEFYSKKGDHVVGRETDWLWLITEHDSGKYTITTANGKLRWFLEDDWPKTPITLHDAPPSDPRSHWNFQKIGRMNTTHYDTAVVNAELARKVREVQVAREEVAQAKTAAAENVARREQAEAKASMKAAKVKEAVSEAARKAREVGDAKQEAAQAKSEAARTLAELEAARREAAVAKEVAYGATRQKEEAESVASRKTAEVEEAKKEANQAKEELAISNSRVRSYFNMLSQLDAGRYNKETRLIQASLLWAAENGYDVASQPIIAQEGFNFNSTNKYGLTPLSLAAQNGHNAVVRLLMVEEPELLETLPAPPNRSGRPLIPAASQPPPPRPSSELTNPPLPAGRRTCPPSLQNDHEVVDDDLRTSSSVPRVSHSRSIPPLIAESATQPSMDSSGQWELPNIPGGSFDLGNYGKGSGAAAAAGTSAAEKNTSWTTVEQEESGANAKVSMSNKPTSDPFLGPAPTPISTEALTSLAHRMGPTIVSSAQHIHEKSKRIVIGDGSSTSFLFMVLSSISGASTVSLGHLVYAQTGGAVQRRLGDIMSGDVVALYKARFKGHKGGLGLGAYSVSWGTKEEPVLGIVTEFEAKKSKIKAFAVNQHPNSYPTIDTPSYKLDDIKAGTLKVFRVAEAS